MLQELILKMIKKLFGGFFELVIYESDLVKKEKFEEAAYSLGLELQDVFNFYSETSEVSKLNKFRNMKVSNNFLELLKKAIEVSELTNGAYDVAIGENILRRKEGVSEVDLKCSYKDIEINFNNVELGCDDLKIDMGSCAKGYIVDKIIEFLKSEGVLGGFIDADGDMVFFGEKDYLIGTQNPRTDGSIGNLKLKNNAIATSGDYNQFYGSNDNSHILNQKDAISITVVADTLLEADIYSTALFVLDKKAREKLIKDKNISCIIVDCEMEVKGYNLNN